MPKFDALRPFSFESDVTLSSYAIEHFGATKDTVCSTTKAAECLKEVTQAALDKVVKAATPSKRPGKGAPKKLSISRVPRVFCCPADKKGDLTPALDAVQAKVLELRKKPSATEDGWFEVRESHPGTPSARVSQLMGLLRGGSHTKVDSLALYATRDCASSRCVDAKTDTFLPCLLYRGLVMTEDEDNTFLQTQPVPWNYPAHSINVAMKVPSKKDPVEFLIHCKPDKGTRCYGACANDARSLEESLGPDIFKKVEEAERRITDRSMVPWVHEDTDDEEMKSAIANAKAGARQINLYFHPYVVVDLQEGTASPRVERAELLWAAHLANDIKKGTELLWDYGPEYWDTQRGIIATMLEAALREARVEQNRAALDSERTMCAMFLESLLETVDKAPAEEIAKSVATLVQQHSNELKRKLPPSHRLAVEGIEERAASMADQGKVEESPCADSLAQLPDPLGPSGLRRIALPSFAPAAPYDDSGLSSAGNAAAFGAPGDAETYARATSSASKPCGDAPGADVGRSSFVPHTAASPDAEPPMYPDRSPGPSANPDMDPPASPAPALPNPWDDSAAPDAGNLSHCKPSAAAPPGSLGQKRPRQDGSSQDGLASPLKAQAAGDGARLARSASCGRHSADAHFARPPHEAAAQQPDATGPAVDSHAAPCASPAAEVPGSTTRNPTSPAVTTADVRPDDAVRERSAPPASAPPAVQQRDAPPSAVLPGGATSAPGTCDAGPGSTANEYCMQPVLGGSAAKGQDPAPDAIDVDDDDDDGLLSDDDCLLVCHHKANEGAQPPPHTGGGASASTIQAVKLKKER